jgi:hypothetical protein
MAEDIDHDALTRCLDVAMRDPLCRTQFADKQRANGWEEAAQAAAYHCQIEALNLKPRQEPPCVADEDDPDERDKQAQALLRRLLAAGLSRYEPNPLKALSKAART